MPPYAYMSTCLPRHYYIFVFCVCIYRNEYEKRGENKGRCGKGCSSSIINNNKNMGKTAKHHENCINMFLLFFFYFERKGVYDFMVKHVVWCRFLWKKCIRLLYNPKKSFITKLFHLPTCLRLTHTHRVSCFFFFIFRLENVMIVLWWRFCLLIYLFLYIFQGTSIAKKKQQTGKTFCFRFR